MMSHVPLSQGDTYVQKTAPEPPKRWEPSPCLVQLVASISPMQCAHGLRWSNLGARWSAPGSRLQLRFQRLSTNCLAARSRYALTQMVPGCVKIQQLWILVLSSWSIADLTARSWCRFWHCRRRPWTLRIDFKGSDGYNVRVTQLWAVRYVTVKKLWMGDGCSFIVDSLFGDSCHEGYEVMTNGWQWHIWHTQRPQQE